MKFTAFLIVELKFEVAVGEARLLANYRRVASFCLLRVSFVALARGDRFLLRAVHLVHAAALLYRVVERGLAPVAGALGALVWDETSALVRIRLVDVY